MPESRGRKTNFVMYWIILKVTIQSPLSKNDLVSRFKAKIPLNLRSNISTRCTPIQIKDKIS